MNARNPRYVNVEDTPADRAVALIATEGLLRFRRAT